MAGPQRIIVVVEENHSFEQIIGSPQAPFLNRLASQGTQLTSFFAITHPSLPNYIAMISGDTHLRWHRGRSRRFLVLATCASGQ